MFDSDTIKNNKSRGYILDLILLAAILIIGVACICFREFTSHEGDMLRVTITSDEEDKTIVDESFSLGETGYYIISYNDTPVIYYSEILPDNYISDYSSGDFNIIYIENGTASVVFANCPDKICVNTADISQVGEHIVCLPHRLVISITDK